VPKIISNSCELVKLCHINRGGPVFLDTVQVYKDDQVGQWQSERVDWNGGPENGGSKNQRTENAGLKIQDQMQGWKMQDLKMQDQ